MSVRLSVFADNRLWTICGSLFLLIRIASFQAETGGGFSREEKTHQSARQAFNAEGNIAKPITELSR